MKNMNMEEDIYYLSLRKRIRLRFFRLTRKVNDTTFEPPQRLEWGRHEADRILQ
jgi:hypothetical protein